MLKLENIVKTYVVGDNRIEALRGVSIEFRKSEFVAILGPSGCGKTTLLNIVGGLDRYTDGRMAVAGRSTEKFVDADWDAYRNHSIGFVFQSYNLIPHQTVLANVELALTLSGVSKSVRRARALAALDQVGLKDQANKKPNQMSGGQMQRVAIARALINDPEILLADEPTGALDSETSVQIMDLLKEIAKDRLVIMVTHNPELADAYATRTIRLLDGVVVSDTAPYDSAEEKQVPDASKTKHTSMSFWTALTLSLNNLMTKKGRTILTAFAGSIGIIGISLILALSTGVKNFINDVQEDTLTSYPIHLMAEEMDMSALISSFIGSREESKNRDDDSVYVNAVMYDLINSMNTAEAKTNDLKKFKAYLQSHPDGILKYATTVQYGYDVPMNIYVKGEDGAYAKTDIMTVIKAMTQGSVLPSSLSSSMMSGFTGYQVWEELLAGEDGALVSNLVKEQYTVLHGDWPTEKNEIVLILDSNNEITDITLYALGLISSEEMIANMVAASQGKEVSLKREEYTFEEMCDRVYRLILNADSYQDNDGDGIWSDISGDKEAFELIIGSGLELKICGVVKPNSSNSLVSGSLGYTSALTEYVLEETGKKQIVIDQQSDAYQNVDIFTGLPFVKEEIELTVAEKALAFIAYLESATDADKKAIYEKILSAYDEEELKADVESRLEFLTTREQVEAMIIAQYKSDMMSEEQLKEYLATYTDEELMDMVRKATAEMLKEMRKSEATAKIEALMNTPSDAEIMMISGYFMQNFKTVESMYGYIFQQYTTTTAMPAEQVAAFLSSLSEAEIRVIMNGMARDYAVAHYSEFASLLGGNADAKVSAALMAYVETLEEEAVADLYDLYMPSGVAPTTYQENLKLLGVADPESPSSIKIYTSTFENKEKIAALIEEYNSGVDTESQITYTDYVALIMSSVTVIIDAISYVLVAFVAVSLVVSSIMIGIITYISVLERTKEIGVLRSIGASKRDISRVFNAETLIIGFTAGLFGVGLSLLLLIPINAIIRFLSGLTDIAASMPWSAAAILVVISMLLTVIAGCIPARLAAKKDPVIALRTE